MSDDDFLAGGLARLENIVSEVKLSKRDGDLDKREAELNKREAALIKQKTKQDEREAALIKQKTELGEREAKLIELDEWEAALIKQKTELGEREAGMDGQPTKKRTREDELDFLIKAASGLAQVEWLADDEMKQDIKAKIKKLTNPE